MSWILWRGNEHALLKALEESNHQAVIYHTVLSETLTKLTRKFGFAAEAAPAFLAGVTEWMERRPDAIQSGEPDDVILATAVAARADYL